MHKEGKSAMAGGCLNFPFHYLFRYYLLGDGDDPYFISLGRINIVCGLSIRTADYIIEQLK
jgi:hypothetical protein